MANNAHNNIPVGWESKNLGDIAHIISGGTPKTNEPKYWNGDINWLSVVDFNNDGRWVHNTEKTITQAGLNESSTKILKTGQIIISARGTVGALAQLGKDMAFNQSCYGLNAIDGITTNDYLYYYIKDTVQNLKSVAYGAVFDAITRKNLESLKIPVPPLWEQRRIVDILGVADGVIRDCRLALATAEKLPLSLFIKTFGDPNQNPNNYPIKKLGDVADVQRGTTITKKQAKLDGTVPVVAGGIGHAYMHDQQNREKGCITISGSGANAGYVNRWGTPIFASDCSTVESLDDLSQAYIYYFLLSLQDYIYTKLQSGMAQPHVYAKDIKRLKIPIPPKSEQQAFLQQVQIMESMIADRKAALTKAQDLFQSLLNKAMTGHL